MSLGPCSDHRGLRFNLVTYRCLALIGCGVLQWRDTSPYASTHYRANIMAMSCLMVPYFWWFYVILPFS